LHETVVHVDVAGTIDQFDDESETTRIASSFAAVASVDVSRVSVAAASGSVALTVRIQAEDAAHSSALADHLSFRLANASVASSLLQLTVASDPLISTAIVATAIQVWPPLVLIPPAPPQHAAWVPPPAPRATPRLPPAELLGEEVAAALRGKAQASGPPVMLVVAAAGLALLAVQIGLFRRGARASEILSRLKRWRMRAIESMQKAAPHAAGEEDARHADDDDSGLAVDVEDVHVAADDDGQVGGNCRLPADVDKAEKSAPPAGPAAAADNELNEGVAASAAVVARSRPQRSHSAVQLPTCRPDVGASDPRTGEALRSAHSLQRLWLEQMQGDGEDEGANEDDGTGDAPGVQAGGTLAHASVAVMSPKERLQRLRATRSTSTGDLAGAASPPCSCRCCTPGVVPSPQQRLARIRLEKMRARMQEASPGGKCAPVAGCTRRHSEPG